MDPTLAHALRALLAAQEIASLGTLRGDEPHVSMVPFALLPREPAFVIHVSGLAAHTRHMLEHPKVSLLVMAPQDGGTEPQALARVTIQGDAELLDPSGPGHGPARAAYLARFPKSAGMFELGDFALFAIRPRSLRFVGGFAQAKTVTPDGLRQALGAAGA